MSRTLNDIPLIRRGLYRVDYFRNVVSGKTWIGKEYFRAIDAAHARELAKKRSVPLGLVVEVHPCQQVPKEQIYGDRRREQ